MDVRKTPSKIFSPDIVVRKREPLNPISSGFESKLRIEAECRR